MASSTESAITFYQCQGGEIVSGGGGGGGGGGGHVWQDIMKISLTSDH